MPRRILVTGAKGLIGRAVTAHLLSTGFEVVAVVRPESAVAAAPGLTILPLDLREPVAKGLQAAGRMDAVIHLAQAPGWHNFPAAASEAASVNVTATVALAQAAVAAGATHFVHASSGGIYGPSPTPIVETAATKPTAELGFYLATKIAAEQLLAHFAPLLALHILRPFFVYGPGQNEAFIIPRLVKSVCAGTPIKLAAGRGPRLNPVFVDDAARCFAMALERSGTTTLNLAGPEPVTLREVAETLGHLLGRLPVFEETAEEPSDYVADVAQLQTRLAPAMTGVAEGLRRTVEAVPEVGICWSGERP